MAFCIQCGTDLLVDEARFCPMCGTPQPDLSQAVAAAPPPATSAAQPAVPPAAADPRPDPVTQQAPVPPAVAARADDDDAFFAGAGSPLASPASAASTPSRPERAERARAPRSATALSPNEAHLWRLGRGDLLVAVGALAVLLSLFVTWFSGTVQASLGTQLGSLGKGLTVPHSVRRDAMGAGAWHWLIFLLVASLFVYIALRTLPGEGVILPVPHWQLVTISSSVILVLVVLSVLLPPDIGSWSPSYGAVIGLVGAMVAFAGAMVRRREPEVITVPSLRTRAAAPVRAPRAAPAPSKPRRSRRAPVTRVASATDMAPATEVDLAASRPATSTRPSAPAPREARTATAAPPAPEPAPVPAQPADDDPPTQERRVAAPQPRAAPRPAAAADEVVCDVCSTVNPTSAKVCRTCGVMLAGRRG